MEKHGQEIAKSLLNRYLWLKKNDYRVRTIQPANIYISPDGKELNFVDLRSLVKGQPDSIHELHGSMPYNCQSMWTKKERIDLSTFLDIWSVGMVLLELIAGTKLVTGIKYFFNCEDLLDELEQYVDKVTMLLLKDMLNDGDDDEIEAYVREILEMNPNAIAENIRAVNAAVEESTVLREIEEKNMEALRQSPEHHQLLFGLKMEDVEESSEEEDPEEDTVSEDMN